MLEKYEKRKMQESLTETLPVTMSDDLHYNTATFTIPIQVGPTDDDEIGPLYEKEQSIQKTSSLGKVFETTSMPLNTYKRESDTEKKKVSHANKSHSRKQSKENKEAKSKQVNNTNTMNDLSANISNSVPSTATDTKKGRVTFRDKFNTCSFCSVPISDRIRICSGCRNAAYCNSKCQKSHWKMHKKQCVYALTKDQKDEVTG